jgi:hypothetical protein
MVINAGFTFYGLIATEKKRTGEPGAEGLACGDAPIRHKEV